MYIDAQTIITAGAVLAALSAIFAACRKMGKWIDRQNKQDEELAELRRKHDEDRASTGEELTLITYGLLACLKGLKEQGCNGPVTEAISKMEKHLNIEAHR